MTNQLNFDRIAAAAAKLERKAKRVSCRRCSGEGYLKNLGTCFRCGGSGTVPNKAAQLCQTAANVIGQHAQKVAECERHLREFEKFGGQRAENFRKSLQDLQAYPAQFAAEIEAAL